MKSRKGDYEQERTCTNCGRKYLFIYKAGKVLGGHIKKLCNSCAANRNRFDRKAKMIEYKGGKCLICGYNRCNRALTFHHLDPSKKDFNFAGSHTKKWLWIQQELDKCVLLCQNCHCEVHAGVAQLKL
jgi:hypothetical protein